METSDSECFESADEEISEESPPGPGFYKTSSNINSLNVKRDLNTDNRTVCLAENKQPSDHHVEDGTIKDNVSCLTKDNNNSLSCRQNVNIDTSGTSNLLKQDHENNRNIDFSGDVNARGNKQSYETDGDTVKDVKKELSQAYEAGVNTNKNLLTKENDSSNMKQSGLLEDDEGIWEDDWSKEAETNVDAKKHLLTKPGDRGYKKEENLVEDDKDIWEDNWSNENEVENIKESLLTKENEYGISKDEDDKNMWKGDWLKEEETEVDTKKSLLGKEGNYENSNKEEDNKDIWEDDWGQWESVSNEKLENIPNKTPEAIPTSTDRKVKSNGSWGDWGSWGVTSLLSTATSGVSTITQGITNALESGIGIPDPEELAKMSIEEKEKLNTNESPTNSFRNDVAPAVEDNRGQARAFNLESLLTGVTQITKLVESTSNKVISGGLDTLETIGKKTMEVLQEGDPGLKKKRAFLRIDSEKINLSQVLREAKEKSQEENKEKKPNTKNVNYETLFDDHHGLVHLEALEMLSKQCNIKLDSIFESSSSEDLVELQETVNQIQELCELPEDEDEQLNVEEVVEKLEESISELAISISYEKLISVWKNSEVWMKDTSNFSCNDIHEKAIDTLAQVTACAVEQFHKSAELLLIKQLRSTADEADSLVQITIALTGFIGYIASEFCKAMTKDETENTDAKDRITNVYFEAANSSSYIKDAFKLLIPVIEVGAL